MRLMSGRVTEKLVIAGILLVACGGFISVSASSDIGTDLVIDEENVLDDPWALPIAVEMAAVKTGSIDFAMDGMPTALQSGTVLMAVDVESGTDGALIHFHADGELALARTFTLNDPARLVVDLPGIRGDLPSNAFVVGGDVIVGVRVGVHPDKLRVVIDGGPEVASFSSYKAYPSGDGLYLIIGDDAELALELESRLDSGASLGRVVGAGSVLGGAPESTPEPIQVAMRAVGNGSAAANPWDEVLEAPDDAAILARISDPYPGGNGSPSQSPGADSSLREKEQKPAKVSGAAEDSEAPESANALDPEPAAPQASASDIWAVEISAEPVQEAPEVIVAAEEVVPSVAPVVAPVEVASRQVAGSTQAEEDFLLRAGKSVETRISDLSVEGGITAQPELVQLAQASTGAGVSETSATSARDPWSLGSEATGAGEATSEATRASASAPAPSEVFGLQYDRDESRDRIAILGDKASTYRIYEPDAETLMIVLENAVLSEGMGERITPEFGGPVSQVTIFQQPDIEGNEVRVVIRRASGLVPDIYQRGSLVLADFPNSAVAESLPVVLIPEESAANETAASEGDAPETLADAAASEGVSANQPEEVIAVAPELISATGGETFGDGDLAEEPMSMASGRSAHGEGFTGSPISLDFKDVPIMDVLRLIAEVSELNIIAGDEVTGAITLRLVQVPWDQALDIVLVTRGLGFVRVGNVLRIAPAEVLQAEEAERLQERRNKEQLEDLEVKLQPVNYAAVADVSELVRRLLSPRGTVNSDERTNTVIIKDIPSVINEATALIEALDTQTPQVMIEAKIVEAALDFGRDLGTKWSVGTNSDNQPFSTGGVTWDGQNSVAVGRQIADAFGAASMGFLVLDDNVRIDVQVEAMEKAGEGKVISSPRIVTLDNREAVIEQGVAIPFQTFEGGDAKLEFVDAVLSLKVTPHITPDESIIMALEVTRNAPDTSVPTSTGSPAIAKNQAKTETLVKNGQTLVIGGIYTIQRATTEHRVPYLHKIPIFGAAFVSKQVKDSRKELLIFVTPRIVVNPALADN
jgi:type IV pilus assembly protein PilQ